MRKAFQSLIATAALLGASAEPAHAACPNPCESTVEPPTVTPELACAGLEAQPRTCDCGASLNIGNGCDAPLEAVDFTFATCAASGQAPMQRCTALEPGQTGVANLRRTDNGRKESVVHFRHQGVEHAVRVMSDVSGVGENGCACRTSGTSSPARPIAAVAALVLLFAHRRAFRVRRPATP